MSHSFIVLSWHKHTQMDLFAWKGEHWELDGLDGTRLEGVHAPGG